MNKCINCGAELEEAAMVCPKCKAEQPRYVILLPAEGKTQIVRCTGRCMDQAKIERYIGGKAAIDPTVIGGDWAQEEGIDMMMLYNARNAELPRNQKASSISTDFDDYTRGNAVLLGFVMASREHIGIGRSAAAEIVDRWEL